MAAFDDTRECSGGRSIMLREGAFSVEHSKQKITTFLMFDGKAEEAMHYSERERQRRHSVRYL